MNNRIIKLNVLLGIPEKQPEVKETWEDGVAEVEKTAEEKAESKMIQRVLIESGQGKVHVKKRQRPKMKAKPPKNWNCTRKSTTFSNFGASLGMTDDEYIAWKKTGALPERLVNKEQN
jgi:hypothetical protein